jgi:hypothetical protein
MTEVAIHNGHGDYAPSVLMQWALDAAEAHKIAQSLVKTAFVPDSMRGKPDEATAAILTGQEIGLQPMAALRSIDIIAGTPAMRANTMRGLVQSKGHRITLVESTATRAVVEGQRKGESVIQKSVWTMERAKGLGLAGKDNWRKQPIAMLVARASSECCRLTASDVLMGIPYSVEELEDGPTLEVVAAPAPVKRTARRKPLEVAELPEPDPQPALEATPGTPTAEEQEWPEPPPDWEPEAAL